MDAASPTENTSAREARTRREAVVTRAAPQALGPYSQAIVGGALIHCAGQIGLDPVTGDLVAGGIAAETHQTLANLRAILEAGGSSMARVLKTTVYLVDLAEFAEMNAVYATYFPERPPARATVGAASLPRGARVEIDAVALAAPA